MAERQMWAVTVDWYDEIGAYHNMARTRREAINNFVVSWFNANQQKTWQQWRRQGWRCVKATVTW